MPKIYQNVSKFAHKNYKKISACCDVISGIISNLIYLLQPAIKTWNKPNDECPTQEIDTLMY